MARNADEITMEAEDSAVPVVMVVIATVVVMVVNIMLKSVSCLLMNFTAKE